MTSSKNQTRTYPVLALTVAVLVITLDQLTKLLAMKFLTPFQPVEIIPNVLNFTLAFNDRAAFSLGGSATWIFTLLSTLAVLLLLFYVRKLRTVGWKILGGFAIGGVAGNLIDRITKAPGFPNGQVIDFIQIPFNFPVFNLADMAISLTAVVIAIRVIRGEKIGGRE